MTLDDLERRLSDSLLEIRARDLKWHDKSGGNAGIAARDRRALLKRLDECVEVVRAMRTKQQRLPGVK
ncbi:MAG TPA: hypothetical protein VNG33_14710 [Polyangiaceae bacterium]|nr:hypothetical protein [Polyangiaceae bacterium]